MDLLKAIFALPFIQIANLIAYVRLQRGLPAKVGMFLTFIPSICVTTILWGAGWWFVLSALFKAFSVD